jgi:tetratricopeptide (TPR) repeat protein
VVALALAACGAQRDRARAEAALRRGDLAGAEAAWRAALDESPDDPDALYGLGWTWHLAGRDDMARDAFQQCVDAHPEVANGYKGLGSVAMADGNPVLAKKEFELALERSPNDLAIRHSLGLLALSTHDDQAALTIFTTLAQEAPDRAEFEQARAEALLRLHRDDDALSASQHAIALGGDDKVRAMALVTRARALVAVAAGRVTADSCATAAPPVYAWLDEADRVLDRAEATGVDVPDLPEVRRGVRRRRGVVDDLCPGLRTGG